MNTFIEILNRTSGGLPHLAWLMFCQSSLLILVIYAMDCLLRRKLRASVRYSLWLVVLIKLLLPPTLALPTGIAWWLRPGDAPPAPVQARQIVITHPDNPIPFRQLPVPTIFKQPALRLSGQAWTLIVAATISIVLLMWLLVRWFQISRTVRQAGEPTDSLLAVLDEARRFIRIGSRTRLRLTNERMSPAVCGLFRPVILLPESLVENLPGSQMRAVLIHELVHLKRGDVWMNCLQALVQIVYWWHPLVWFANARIRRVREEAVDDAVMLALRDEADCYTPTLLEVAKLAFHRPLASLGLVGILESRGALRQRIERLIDFKTPRRAGLSIVSTLAIVAFTAAAVPMGEAPPRSPSETKATQGTHSGSDTNSSLLGIVTDPQFKTVLTELQQREQLSQLIQDARLLFELGKYDEAERRLNEALRVDPKSAAANYYLTLVRRSQDQKKISGSGNLVNDLVYRTTNQQAHAAKPIQLAQNSSLPASEPLQATAPISPLDGVLAFDNQLKEATVNAGEAEAKFKFNLTNVSSFDVTITNILTSCGCTVAKMPSSPWLLAPGAIGEIPVTMNLAGKSGVLTKTVSVNSDKGTKVLTVKATIRSVEEAGSSDTQQASRVIGSSVRDQSNALVDTLVLRKFKVDPNTFMQAIERETGINFPSVPQTTAVSTIPRVAVNGNSFVAGTVRTNPMSALQSAFIAFFRARGVDLSPPKTFFYGDRRGDLMVYATTEDLDIIEAAIQTLNLAPPQINVRVKFIELDENIANALWLLWNQTNRLNPLPGAGAPTAILTIPAMKDLMSALRKQPGVTELSVANVTTLSGRQAQIQIAQITNVVSGITNGTYQTIKTVLGPVLDVVPYVSADGYTIQMTISPSFTEFLGYDDPQKVLPSGMKSPLPHFRVRQMTTSAIVWDGQTVVLSRLPQTDVVTSNGTTSTNATAEDPKRNLFVLITPTIIDPVGNRVHTDEQIDSLPATRR